MARRALIALVWVVTMIALFYGEEDWRGRRTWNKYSDALKAQGEELDFKAFIPQPIPDAENFAATPEIQSWFIQHTNIGESRFENKWNTDVFDQTNIKPISDSDKIRRRMTDLVAWQRAFEALAAGHSNDLRGDFNSDQLDLESRAKAAPAVLAALKPMEGTFDELRAASERPQSRYPVVYDLENPWGILLPHLSNIRSVCLRLQLRACAELALGKSDEALKDVRLILRMSDSLNEEPFLISYLVRIATFHIATQPIWEGLAEQRWTDAQLKELQGLMERYNFIADMKPPLSGERSAGILTADLLAQGKFRLNNLTSDPSPSGAEAADAFGMIMPRGWYDLEKFNYSRLYDLQLKGAFDAREQRVFPGQIEANTKALKQAFAGRNPVTTILTRHQLLAAILLPALGNVLPKGALAQTVADEALIACGLERYRLAQGQFPATLEALSPDFISKLPNDVITGTAYKYRRTDGGKFVLYSVGWNETDDGGEAAMKRGTPDPNNGDWVWQYP
jgi:hypothetical protein